MDASRSRSLGLAALAAALAVLLVIGFWSYRNWKQYQTAFTEHNETRQILALNEELIGLMKDAETGQRGFLLTGMEYYLEPYKNALAQIPDKMNDLAALVARRPGERARFDQLRTLIGVKLTELRETIEVRRSAGAAAALAIVETNRGKRTMDGIRGVSREIESAEDSRWLDAWNGLQSVTQHLRFVTLGGVLLLVCFVAVGGGALNSAADNMERLIAELRRSKHSAEQISELLKATLYSIGDAVMTTDREGSVQMMNAVAERLTGYQESEARGQRVENIFRIVNEATRVEVENPVRGVLRKGQTVGLANHTVLISKAGVDIPIDDCGAPIRASDGSMSGTVLVFRDVSARKRADETTRRLAAIVENSDDAIIGKTLEGRVTTWNRGAERLFGYSAGEMIGSPISRLIPPDHAGEMERILDKIGHGESIDHFQTERITKDGRILTVSLTVSPIRDSEGHVIGASKIARDISHERDLEEMLRQTQKMQAVGRLAGGVAHDFNNLLTVILTYATTVLDQAGPDGPLRRSAGEILRAGERAAALTGQLLAFSRKQVTHLRILDLNAQILEIRDMLERLIGEDIDLAVVLDKSLSPVKADAGHFAQVLMNLAVNARDAMPKGGKLTIETHNVYREREDLGHRGIRPAGHFSQLVVTDTGCGMDQETQAHLFEPFFTTKEAGKGTGLGLATVHGIVQQHGGWIDVYSEPGHGATFRIYLPSAEGNPLEDFPTAAQSFPRKTATILLVEDQAAIRIASEDVLAEAGHHVLSAANGRAALELLEKDARSIDLLITDVVMPEMSGPELAEQLNRTRPGLIVLYVSGYSDHALFHRGVIEQGTAFLPKPFLPQSLLAKVDEMLNGSARVQRSSG